jgi:hypothetical protein
MSPSYESESAPGLLWNREALKAFGEDFLPYPTLCILQANRRLHPLSNVSDHLSKRSTAAAPPWGVNS